MIGKILGLSISLAVSIAGLALAASATAIAVPVAPRDPIGWLAIASGLAIFGVGACMTMIWMSNRRRTK